jgi:hypothetical protein
MAGAPEKQPDTPAVAGADTSQWARPFSGRLRREGKSGNTHHGAYARRYKNTKFRRREIKLLVNQMAAQLPHLTAQDAPM